MHVVFLKKNVVYIRIELGGKAMTYIFIGYILVFFHIKINGFDLLANFVGYFLIYKGTDILSIKSTKFNIAKKWAFVMSILSFMSSFARFFRDIAYHPIWLGIGTVTVVLFLYILYQIDKGLIEMEESENIVLGAGKLLTIWKVQVVTQVLSTVLSFIQDKSMQIIVSVFTIGALIANIVFLIQFYSIKKIYEGVVAGK